jgi:hypothetical protein
MTSHEPAPEPGRSSAGRLLNGAIAAFEQPLSSRRPSGRELFLSCGLIALLAVLIYVNHVLHGGWYSDDWAHVDQTSGGIGLVEAFELDQSPLYRPLQTLVLAVLFVTIGSDPTTHLSIGVLLAGLQGWLFYVVLRVLRLRPLIAALASAMFVVLPYIDATRLWPTMIPIQFAGCLFLLGLLAALRGLSRSASPAWHAIAAFLYAAAMLTYELVVGLVMVVPLLYAIRAGWRRAIPRLAVDYMAIAVVLAVSLPSAADERPATLTPDFVFERARQLLAASGEVFRSMPPWSEVSGGTPGLLLLLAGVVGAGIAIRAGSTAGRAFAAWGKIALVALVFALGGLLMFFVGDPYYVPRLTGLGNRTAVFAAFGAVLLLISLIAIALGGLGSLLRQPRAGWALALLVVVATSADLAVRELRQQDSWAASWSEQQRIVAAFEPIARDLPAEVSLVSFGHPTHLADEVPVFYASWDLRGALKTTYDLPGLSAHPWTADGLCTRSGVSFVDSSGTARELYGYHQLIFVDVRTRASVAIRDRRACVSTIDAWAG